MFMLVLHLVLVPRLMLMLARSLMLSLAPVHQMHASEEHHPGHHQNHETGNNFTPLICHCHADFPPLITRDKCNPRAKRFHNFIYGKSNSYKKFMVLIMADWRA
jgi:hypothetical protein